MGLRNIFFNLKYPFWKGNYNKIPYGWRISFGKDLSKSLLNSKDVSDFERESGIKVYYNLPPVNDRDTNSNEINKFLVSLGFTRQTYTE